MYPRTLHNLVLPVLLLAFLGEPLFSQSTAAEWLAESGRLLENRDMDASHKALLRAIELAVTEQNRQVEADARTRLGQVLGSNADYGASDSQLEIALRLYEEAGNRARAALVKTVLARHAFFESKSERVRTLYLEALTAYESIGDMPAVARMHYNLVFASSDHEEAMRHIELGLEIARQYGAKRTEALLLHAWGDRDYAADDYRSAFERLDRARAILEETDDDESLAAVLTSIGRLYRVHGHSDQAIPYYQRAFDLQKQSGSKQGMIQSLNAMATALGNQGRRSEALDREEEALRLARETGSSLLIKFAIEGVADCLESLERFDKAAELLEEARQMSPPRMNTFRVLAKVRLDLGQYSDALKAADDGLALEHDRDILAARAHALWKLGRMGEALGDVRELLDSIEHARATLVPTDFMKQGFSDTLGDAADLSINLLLDSREENQALAAAEQWRSRAFLDLLATRDLAAKVEPLMSPAVNSTTPPPSLVRGGNSTNGRPPAVKPVTAIPSLGTAPAASTENMVELAARLDSTILEYWVEADSTVIWTISEDGRIHTARSRYGQNALNRLIDEALHQSPQVAASGQKTNRVPSRAGDAVLTSGSAQDAWRRLYDALIRPIRQQLPLKGARRLTIIPNGPLFRLSFAALMSEKGRYLIEDYAIHYAPAAGVFSYTSQTKARVADLPRSYVLVANPSGMPPLSDGKTLPRLPGSDEEVRRIAQLLPQGAVTTLRGAGADEASVRKAMASSKVIHLATHGIVDGANPLGSFLALGRLSDSPDADGRLTAAEVYGMDLHADLVVLSACRTGIGPISGDGVAGLARAFFYAGAATVVSTLWDVADGPASQLVATFYQSLSRANSPSKVDALRTAQLNLLRSLRNGQVHVDTPFGKLTLPEDPILWAGFVLMGEP
jgi:CHAT domain-containing protein/tetratricopeptide (TPR) repeat protein